ncbi:hypothetical protein [Streptomyces smyrnaeus]
MRARLRERLAWAYAADGKAGETARALDIAAASWAVTTDPAGVVA